MTVVNHDNDFVPNVPQKDLIPATVDLVSSDSKQSEPQSILFGTGLVPIKSNESTPLLKSDEEKVEEKNEETPNPFPESNESSGNGLTREELIARLREKMKSV